MTGVWFAGIRAIALALGVQEAPGGASFVGARLSVDAQQEGPRDATNRLRKAPTAAQSLPHSIWAAAFRARRTTKSEFNRLSDCRGIVEASPPRASGDERRAVEDLEQTVGLGAALLQVDRAARRPRGVFLNHNFPGAGAIGRHVRPALARIQLSGGNEHGVTDRLGIEPQQWKAGEQAVIGIDATSLWISSTRLPVNRRPQDQPMKGLGPPARPHQLGCEEFEQLGMSRGRSRVAEVFRGGCQPCTKMMLPDAIGQHASQQSGRPRAGCSKPSRQCEPPARWRMSLEKALWAGSGCPRQSRRPERPARLSAPECARSPRKSRGIFRRSSGHIPHPRNAARIGPASTFDAAITGSRAFSFLALPGPAAKDSFERFDLLRRRPCRVLPSGPVRLRARRSPHDRSDSTSARH